MATSAQPAQKALTAKVSVKVANSAQCVFAYNTIKAMLPDGAIKQAQVPRFNDAKASSYEGTLSLALAADDMVLSLHGKNIPLAEGDDAPTAIIRSDTPGVRAVITFKLRMLNLPLGYGMEDVHAVLSSLGAVEYKVAIDRLKFDKNVFALSATVVVDKFAEGAVPRRVVPMSFGGSLHDLVLLDERLGDDVHAADAVRKAMKDAKARAIEQYAASVRPPASSTAEAKPKKHAVSASSDEEWQVALGRKHKRPNNLPPAGTAKQNGSKQASSAVRTPTKVLSSASTPAGPAALAASAPGDAVVSSATTPSAPTPSETMLLSTTAVRGDAYKQRSHPKKTFERSKPTPQPDPVDKSADAKDAATVPPAATEAVSSAAAITPANPVVMISSADMDSATTQVDVHAKLRRATKGKQLATDDDDLPRKDVDAMDATAGPSSVVSATPAADV